MESGGRSGLTCGYVELAHMAAGFARRPLNAPRWPHLAGWRHALAEAAGRERGGERLC